MSQLSVVSGPLQEKPIACRAELKGDDEMIITRYVLFLWHFAINEVNPQGTPRDSSKRNTAAVLLQQTVNKWMGFYWDEKRFWNG